jgi:hypothetical protein
MHLSGVVRHLNVVRRTLVDAERRHVNRLVPTAGFLLLSTMVVVLLGFTVYEAWLAHIGAGIIAAGVLIGALAQILRESRRVPCKELCEAMQRESILSGLAVLGGALVTYALACSIGLSAVNASALVGLIGALILPVYGVPIYCGSFVGMTSIQLLNTHWEFAIAGVVAGLLFMLTDGAFPGIGGKLGTIAFAGTVITGLGLERQFIIAPVPSGRLAFLIIAYATIATVATYWLSVTKGHGAVIGSSVVGLAGGLILPALHTEHGYLLAVVVFCASFTGMSSRERFPRLLIIVIIGLITGLVFVYSTPLLGGAGGKLGTIAFGSALAGRGYMDLLGTASAKSATTVT